MSTVMSVDTIYREIEWSLVLANVPGQQFGDAPGRIFGDASDDLAQVRLGIEAVKLSGLDQRIHQGRALTTGIGTGEGPVVRPTAIGRMARSAALLQISSRPSVAKRVIDSQRDVV